MKKLTEMGELLRTIRKQRSMTQTEMAKILEVSSAFLSYVEVGVKLPPKTWKEVVPTKFDLTKTETKRFLETFEETINIQRKIEKVILTNKVRETTLKYLLDNNIEDEVFAKINRLIMSKDESIF
ncbi:MAG: helix-turn-helix domain-containing protein [Clostridia bacterium]|nr:helix-turn-helix domain-containing protein [Clostridia bacterium]